jgi:hypothetical protein
MSLVHQRRESGSPAVQDQGRPTDAIDGALEFSRPFFTARVAAMYVCSKSIRAFYEWARRHGIVRRSNGSVAKVDLDRVLRRKRKPRVMQPTSLANLRKVRHGR